MLDLANHEAQPSALFTYSAVGGGSILTLLLTLLLTLSLTLTLTLTLTRWAAAAFGCTPRGRCSREMP